MISRGADEAVVFEDKGRGFPSTTRGAEVYATLAQQDTSKHAAISQLLGHIGAVGAPFEHNTSLASIIAAAQPRFSYCSLPALIAASEGNHSPSRQQDGHRGPQTPGLTGARAATTRSCQSTSAARGLNHEPNAMHRVSSPRRSASTCARLGAPTTRPIPSTWPAFSRRKVLMFRPTMPTRRARTPGSSTAARSRTRRKRPS